jgi:hypothetical protein
MGKSPNSFFVELHKLRLHTPALEPVRDHDVDMPILLQAPRAELTSLLDAYAREFEWYAFCLVCSHMPERGQESLQALYQAQARWRGSRMQELYPLVCAHWDVVHLAHQMADARSELQRKPLELMLRNAKVRHRAAMRALRETWGVPLA